jgi:hypothetical protein
LHATYERKTGGHGSEKEEGCPFQIQISVEPISPCLTKTTEEEKLVNQQVIGGRRIFVIRGSSGISSKSLSSTSNSQVSTPYRGGSTTNFIMAGVDPTITYENYEEKGWRTQKNICSFARRFGYPRRLQMEIQRLRSWKSHSGTTH